ncbi:leucine-rich repeat protein [Chryseobacterium sp. SNU WT5]|uniref:leucine-rich repeat domain-containing protein n=1 Tax=Chryseobacterium sp. SNU WT5 TaxID=2594269 RepID=UPI00117FB16A|nr:leucine-rich repeat domain-containing protein [Chryseobacterium sp. SNU WT5]QDP86508.1 leucine-rich repeat protein [Chryseobacterium sp. SNU WT5]
MLKNLSVLLFCFITTVFASAQTFNVDGINYNITGATTVEVSTNPGFSGAAMIPATVTNGMTYSVTSIGDNAFQSCTGLTNLTIEGPITSIGNAAFMNCSGLTSISIPNSVNYIGGSAFESCTNLTSITIGSSVASIGDYAFYDCTGLTSVICNIEIPLAINTNIFENVNQSACSLTVPSGSVSAYQAADVWMAFSPIEPQTFTVGGINYKVIGPNKVEVGSNSSFAGVATIPPAVTNGTKTYTVTSIGEAAFYYCAGLTSVIIPDSVTSIGNYAFYGCEVLSSVTIGNSVTSIGISAFYDCKVLSSITIPSSVTSIKNGAFGYCFGLTSLIIPDSVTSIEDYAFSYCTGLTSIILPDSLISLGAGAFYGCSKLTSLIIPDSVTSIEDYAFTYCTGLTSIILPDSLISLGAGAFYGCSKLASLTIPNSVISIGNYAFYGCSSLSSLTIGNSVTSIGNQAFADCSDLTSVTIPNSVTSIGNYAFYGTNLTSVICNLATPLTVNAAVFGGVNQSNCSLTVPSSSVSAYQAANVWKDFSPIIGAPILSTSESNSKNNIVLYPNPVHNEAILELKNSDNSQLEVYDINGKMVLRKSLNNNSKNTINTSNLPNGIYLFKVGKSVTKVIKN